MTETLERLPITAVVPNPDQPRQHFDQAALQELADSIAANGLLQPIVVRRKTPRSKQFVIIAGERRWRACQLAGLTEIPAMVRKPLSDDDAFVLSVIENVNRKDMQPMEEARAYRTMVESGRDVETIARLTGKTTRWVQMFLDLCSLTESVEELLNRGGIEVGVAWAFSRISPAGQQVALRKYMAGEFKSPRDAQAFAMAVRANEQAKPLFDDPTDPEQSAKLRRAKREATDRFQKVGRMADVLNEIAAMDPNMLVSALEGLGGPAVWRDQLGLVAIAAGKAQSTLRKSAAMAEARRDAAGVA